MPLNRCQCKTANKKVCKLNYKFIIENRRVCYLHARTIYNNNVLKIQSVYKGYITRKKLGKLYYNLPNEIQNKVLYYLREPYYLNKYNNSISRVLKHRAQLMFDEEGLFMNNLIYTIEDFVSIKAYKDIINLYELYIKYNTITDSVSDKQLFYNCKRVWKLYCRHLLFPCIVDENNKIIFDDNRVTVEFSSKLKKTLNEWNSITLMNYPELLDIYPFTNII